MHLNHPHNRPNMQAHLKFSASASLAGPHTGTFPPAVLHLVRQHEVQRLWVSLCRGHLTQDSASFVGGHATALPPPGLEVAVQFDSHVTDSQAAFDRLGQALAALLAAAVPSLAEHGVMARPAVGWFGATAVQRCVCGLSYFRCTPCCFA